MGDFYGTGIEIWAGFGPVGITEKKLGQLWATFEAGYFMSSWAKKIKIKNIVASALKSCIKWSYFFFPEKIKKNF
jgi:hypothetical protein